MDDDESWGPSWNVPVAHRIVADSRDPYLALSHKMLWAIRYKPHVCFLDTPNMSAGDTTTHCVLVYATATGRAPSRMYAS